jgi:3-oxoacyl-[acyl-carrier-protein] synthase II
MRRRVLITGLGAISAAGCDPEAVAACLADGRTGITSQPGIFTPAPAWVGLVPCFEPSRHFTAEQAQAFDRTSQLAILAARQALQDAFPAAAARPAAERTALVMGTSHGGRGQLDRFVEGGNNNQDSASAWQVLVGAPHYCQTSNVARVLDVGGPVVTTSNACSSSGLAVGYAYELLQAGQADLVLAGGADAFSKLTFSGFSALGAMADSPCSPFSTTIGLNLGEGAAFVALETEEHANRRKGHVHAELLGYGLSWDAFHITEPEPSGDGILRAMRVAAAAAGVSPSEIDYVHTHGTGTRANDVAESLALKRFFEGHNPLPPTSATKSITGHTLGASSVLGLVLTLLAMARGLIPATVNFKGPRRGCDLDYVPNEARAKTVRYFLAQSAAFGGANAALVVGKFDPARPLPPRRTDGVAITGLGVLSPLGHDLESFLAGLREGRCGIGAIERFETKGCSTRCAGLVPEIDPRSVLPDLDWRRIDRVAKYAILAARGALLDAGLLPVARPERIGLVVGTARGAVTSFEKYLESVRGGRWRNASPISFPNLVMSSIGGQVSKAFGLKGLASTVVAGVSGGLQALAHGFEMLRQDDGQDAVVVVAADEVGALYFRLLDRLGGVLAPDAAGLAPYDPSAPGLVLGEGAAAVVLERSASARQRGARAWAEVAGYGLSTGADAAGQALERAGRLALAEAGLEGLPELAYGHGHGLPAEDGREAQAWARLLGEGVPLGCVLGSTGVAEAASGLYSVVAAAAGLARGEAYPVATAGTLPGGLAFVRNGVRPGPYRHALVMGGTGQGNCAAVVLRRAEARGGEA